MIERLREWKRDRAHQQQQTDSESDSDDENECNGSRNDMLADSGWVETIRDKNYAGGGGGGAKSNKESNNNNNNGSKSEFMTKTKEGEMSKEFRQMNIADSSGNSSGSDLLMGDKMSQSANFKLQQVKKKLL